MAGQDTQPLKTLLQAAGKGDPIASAKLMPLVYDELRKLAQARMAKTPPGNTLQPTALVHEAYVRLVGEGKSPTWNSRGHFFSAAAEAMRQILVEQARRKAAIKHGGGRKRVQLPDDLPVIEPPAEDILALNGALERLRREDAHKADIVMLRHFAGLTREEAAEVLGVSVRTLDREWRYIIARLHREMSHKEGDVATDPRRAR